MNKKPITNPVRAESTREKVEIIFINESRPLNKHFIDQLMQLIQSEKEALLEEVLNIIAHRDPEDYMGDIELKIEKLKSTGKE